MFLRMALLNLVKHRRRTALVVFAILLSVLVMEVVAGMFEGMRVNFFRNLTSESGHLQIHARGYRDRLNPFTLDHTIRGYREVAEKLREIPGVIDVEEMLHFGAILEHQGRDITLAGVGVRGDTQFYRSVRDGMREGSREEPFQGGGILLSTAVARLLRTGLGEGVNVIVEDSTGSPFYLQFPVTGIFETLSPDFDENTFFIDHTAAQELLYLEDETIEIRLRLADPERAEVVKTHALQLPGGGSDASSAGKAPAGESPAGESDFALEIRTWRELNAGLTSLLEMMDFFILMMNLLVVLVVASVITNAILMNVFERMRVIGTMRAIGLKRRSAGAMILMEGLIQGVTGSVLGLALGIPIVLYFSAHGIDWGGISEAFGMGSAYYYFGYSPLNSALSALGGVLVALVGSVYAARVGMRLSILEALHHV
jgi:putative ABC transport system permease protein